MTPTPANANLECLLTGITPAVVRQTPNRWRVSLPAPAGQIELRAIDEWLCLRASVAAPGQSPGTAPDLDLLRRQSEIGDGVKFAHDRYGRLEIRAELYLPESSPDGREIQETVDHLAGALASALNGSSAAVYLPAPAAEPAAAARETLESSCSEAGWPFRARPDGSLQVELEPAALGLTARVRPAGQSRFRATANLIELALFDSDLTRHALARCLLLLNGAIRGVRAGIRAQEGVEFAMLEGSGGDLGSGRELAAVLSALSVGGRLCVEELAALTDPEISRHYLAHRGEQPTKSEDHNQHEEESERA